jgi:hypothetical protein
VESSSIHYSRFQVMSAGMRAWVIDHRNVTFYYDGLTFWRLNARRRRKHAASWECPRHGWQHERWCACDLCSSRVTLDGVPKAA